MDRYIDGQQKSLTQPRPFTHRLGISPFYEHESSSSRASVSCSCLSGNRLPDNAHCLMNVL